MYKFSSIMATDMYNLTMAYAYWRLGRHNDQAVYHLSFRQNPFKGGFIICAGLQTAIDNIIQQFNITDEEKKYLTNLTDSNGDKLFSEDFILFLQNMQFSCDIHAVPEGTIAFPNEPLVRVSGPIIQCQLIETLLLNTIGFQSLIATKAARICLAAKNKPVVEFGMRRAHNIEGSMLASRAAFIGGCVATSNMLAGRKFNIPVRGTQSHSWITSFDKEEEAFKQYAAHTPHSMHVFLVDTYCTLKGIKTAIKVAKELQAQGRKFIGIRIDSGDLAWFSKQARSMFDQAGLKEAKIFASNEVDEYIIESIEHEGGKVDCWGVGTKLVTGGNTPSLGCVYKLSALKQKGQAEWQYKIKISEQIFKTSIPGMQQIKRFISDNGEYLGDMIFDELNETNMSTNIIDPVENTHNKNFTPSTKSKLLLKHIVKAGQLLDDFSTLPEIQKFVKTELKSVHSGIKRFINPHQYPAGLEENLYKQRAQMIEKLKESAEK
jgi:nicotinate phosphoribosyltransferase